MKFVINDIKESRVDIIGTKAKNLFFLQRHFSVPDFVVVSTEAFQNYQKYGKISPELKQKLSQVFTSMLKKGPVAVRSSCTAEDLKGVSYAGMYTTSLNIRTVDHGINAVIQTWNSVNEERVKKYQEHFNLTSGMMAVIIQEQISSEISGVMVTQSPFSVSEMLIECCRGTGDKLVSGQITPSRYHIRPGDIIDCQGEDIITKQNVLKLAATGKKIERLFKSPQDIEWAMVNSKIYILQSRSVMVTRANPRRKGKVWCNANVRETVPDPLSPMGWSIFDNVFFPDIIMNVFGLPVNRKKYEEYRPVELISGRLYWNVNNTIAYGKSIGWLLDLVL